MAKPGKLIEIRDLKVGLDAVADPEAALRREISRKLHVAASELGELVVVRRALDARRHQPQFVYSVRLALKESLARRVVERGWGANVATQVARLRNSQRQGPSSVPEARRCAPGTP